MNATFIVRLSTDEAGRVGGVVEQVRSGQKERVTSVEAIGAAIARMLDDAVSDITRGEQG